MLKKINPELSQDQLLTVQQAADYLGVHVATIRRWAYAKLLNGTKIGVRGDWRFSGTDLQKMATAQLLTDNQTQSELLLAPYADWRNIHETSHFVQFYEDDTFLLNSIHKYIDTGDAAIVIATPEHREQLKKTLPQQNNYIFLDAAETLSRFMVEGRPDTELFDAVVGTLIRETGKEYTHVRAYGEMVALLWAAGNKTGAVLLEELWNELQKKYPFTLYCAYPMKNIGDSDASIAFGEVCTTHSSVLPTETYSELDTHDKRLREIAMLQQKAQALEGEIENHKKTELKLLQTVEALQELEQRKDDFLSATSHELKTPLTSQKAFIQLLQLHVEKNKEDKYVRYVKKINEQTDKLTKLVTNLLDVSKVQGGKLILTTAPFDINDCVRESVDEIQATTTKQTIHVEGKMSATVVGDKERISQVVINLLTNAIKYSPTATKINVSIKTAGKQATVLVKDFGIGIDTSHQDKIFDRFYRVNDKDEKTYPGLGLGLYIASEIIKQHGGTLFVTSVKGKGSTFGFTLPLS